ncbi:type II toxin-antitoxin system death-on-curing family toxin [Collinsella sp. AGMB00827]|uniref:Type II toxin-antitoxin system death-on-curing family toxin n=1 Tax=Collinsella ureilytica TaxID=2869515 RepID=A0ABS7MJW3_9ACTN|nr:type II toxin-antitoxin system death-on-curing family toxin [Collinsella urealyticum]MBY4797654.1 type II toxin-antitoxin system death-on-curing family toxin [Collinsella urealyticum]
MKYDTQPTEFATEEHVYGFAEAILDAHAAIEREQACFCELTAHQHRQELIGKLSSLVTNVFVGYGGSTPHDKYADIFEQVSDIGLKIAKLHAFLDGNKRTAVSVVLLTLRRAGIMVKLEDGEHSKNNEVYQWIHSAVSENKDIRELAEVLRSKAVYYQS